MSHIDPLLLHELPHPCAASPSANLERVLVFDIVNAKEKAWLLDTGEERVWMPVSQLHHSKNITHPEGVVLFIPEWLHEEKFGVS